MITGQRVTIHVNGQTTDGVIILGSDNLKSLAIQPDEPFTIGDAVCLGILALVMNEAGQYEDLVTGAALEVQWSTGGIQ
jgi:hypothetical protein